MLLFFFTINLFVIYFPKSKIIYNASPRTQNLTKDCKVKMIMIGLEIEFMLLVSIALVFISVGFINFNRKN